MCALATAEIESLIFIAEKYLPRTYAVGSPTVVVCPDALDVLTYGGQMFRNALHTAALTYAGTVWDANRDDIQMTQFLLEFRAWINTPGREVTLR